MRRLVFALLFVISAWAQSIPVLSQSQIQQLEAKLAQDPFNSQNQTLLGQNYAFVILGITSLGQYDTVASVDPALAGGDFARHARDAMQTSVLTGVVAEGGKALWNFSFQVQGYEALHLSQPQVPYLDARALGVQSLDRAITIEPGDPTWRYYRIPITVFRSNFDFLPLSAADAYRQVKEDLSLLTGATRDASLAYGAKLAVRAWELDDAQKYAIELLNSATDPNDWNYGNALFFGNMVLGQVALRLGDIESAMSRLLSSGKTPGSPQLNSFGPNMSLARDLLAGVPFVPAAGLAPATPPSPRRHAASPGVQQTVLSFFDLCGVFWQMDDGRLQQWSQQVRAGGVPDFGANLYY